MMFHVGQMVVCISDFEDRASDPVTTFPLVGMVYTIRGIESGDGGIGIFLEEIVNPPMLWPGGEFGEADFWIGRFRPVKRTNIEIFRKLVAPSPDKVTA